MNRFAMQINLFAVVLGSSLGAAACTSGTGEPTWRGSVEIDGAVADVMNPDSPVFGAGDASVALAWRLPPPQEAGGASGWTQPTRLAVGDEEIYVLDPMAHTVHVLTFSGELVRSVGRQGTGPGELGRTFGVASLGGMLAVGNSGAQRVELFTPAGELSGGVSLESPAFTLTALGPSALLVRTARGEQRVYEIDGTTRRIPFTSFTGAENAREPACLRLAGGGDRILQLDCTTPSFNVVSLEGERLRTVRVRREPVPATPAELERYRSSLAADMGRDARMPHIQARQLLERLTRNQDPKRLMRGIRYDSASDLYVVWEQQPQELGSGPARVHLFGGKGIFLATLEFEEWWVDFEMKDLVLYALTEDPETGLVGLSAYEVSVSPALRSFASAPPEDI